MSTMPKGLTAATGMDQAAYRKAAIDAVRQLSVEDFKALFRKIM